MTGISPTLKKRLEEVLSKCGPFRSDRELRTVFLDARISLWRDTLPQSDNSTQRILSTVESLYEKYNDSQENALVLFLRVLSERCSPNDSCYHQLSDLAIVCEYALSQEKNQTILPSPRELPKRLNMKWLFPVAKYIVIVTLIILTLYAIIVNLDNFFGPGYNTSTPPPSPNNRILPKKTIVQANQEWQSTGVSVEPGMRVSISIQGGSWTAGRWGNNGGIGAPENCRKDGLSVTEFYTHTITTPFMRDCADLYLSNSCRASLLAMVGERVFSVGEQSSIVAQDSGEVLLRINDAMNFDDNSGTLIVETVVRADAPDKIQKTVEIESDKTWQPTKVSVNNGDFVVIEVVRGEWTHGKGSLIYNAGEGLCRTCTPGDYCQYPKPDYYQGALIGRVGEETGGSVFSVGRQTAFVAKDSGTLNLRINDSDATLGDNVGTLVVKITVE